MRSLRSQVRRLGVREPAVMAADKTRSAALRVACPRCGADDGVLCTSVVGSKRGFVKRWPHNARKAAA